MGRRNKLGLLACAEHYRRAVGQGFGSVWPEADYSRWAFLHHGLLFDMGRLDELAHGHRHPRDTGSKQRKWYVVALNLLHYFFSFDTKVD